MQIWRRITEPAGDRRCVGSARSMGRGIAARGRGRQQPGSGSGRQGRVMHSKMVAHGIPTRQLGSSGMQVPALCFGTMLFGELNTWDEALQLLSSCTDYGINFFDSAEMYPVPQSPETQGRSEEFLGRWMSLQGSPRREDLVIATKVAGPSGQMPWIRGGPSCLDRRSILEAAEGSLLRLRTDYIDLLQLHWPDRYVPMFGESEYDPHRVISAVPLEEQLEALATLVQQGKARHIGLSNETAWGVMSCLQLAEMRTELPRIAALQNAFSLMCRTLTTGGLAECCHVEEVGVLAYSPLAMGLLTGKYLLEGGGPQGARLNRYRGLYAEAESRYGPKANVKEAVASYAGVARRHGLSPTALALRFVVYHPMVCSAVIGASDTLQLRELVAAVLAGPLPRPVLQDIDTVHARYPNPTP